jgi:transcriptional regulator with XRE-family HTH domain
MTARAGHDAVGGMLRGWRQRRHLSQLDLSLATGVTTRHISFVETGRSRPSREMVLHLAEHLRVPLRERNALLLAAGFAPTFPEADLSDEHLRPLREALEAVLRGHEPYPAILVDRHWDLVASNRAAAVFTEDVAPVLLEPPVNVLRLTLHPEGLAPRIRNLTAWADHILGRIRQQTLVSTDPRTAELAEELRGYVEQLGISHEPPAEAPLPFAVPMLLQARRGELSLVATLATFGTPLDVTLSELRLEAFLPADARTADLLANR